MYKIAVCGCGVVGSGVCDALIHQREKLSRRFAQDVGLAYVLDIRDLKGTPYEEYKTDSLETILSDPEVQVVTITIGGLDLAADYCFKALEAGKHVVTSNKAVVAAHGPELEKLAFSKRRRFMYEASVGGGIPIIRPLNICLYANDITEIQGILNGTTNYMLTGMFRRHASFDEMLARAQRKGYAEADPTADVDGYDAARKIAILSSIAYGGFVDYREVPCRGIRKVLLCDHELADKAGFTIKLIAGSRFEDGCVYISVEPKLVPRGHLLSDVNSVYNAILTKGCYTGDTLFYGQGAGKEATASAVVGDIIELLGTPSTVTLPEFVNKKATVAPDNRPARYYLRFTSLRPIRAGSLIDLFGDDTLCLYSKVEKDPWEDIDVDVTGAVITPAFTPEELAEKVPGLNPLGATLRLTLKVLDD
ncbi:MAG: homoserine dehydrogenase [Clostridia bacterium]|nr:homoserine dehydrogenase [Clostridia bacterium]